MPCLARSNEDRLKQPLLPLLLCSYVNEGCELSLFLYGSSSLSDPLEPCQGCWISAATASQPLSMASRFCHYQQAETSTWPACRRFDVRINNSLILVSLSLTWQSSAAAHLGTGCPKSTAEEAFDAFCEMLIFSSTCCIIFIAILSKFCCCPQAALLYL